MSDISGNTMYLIKPDGSKSVYRQPSHWSNGLVFALDGSLIAGEFEAGTVARIDSAGQRTVVVDRYDGKRLNGPDDLTINTDGSVYFTDPDFGCKLPYAPAARTPELNFEGVYHLDLQTKALTVLEAKLVQPNGIGLMPGGRELIVSDTGTGEVFLFELNPAGSKVTAGRRIADFPNSSLENGWVDSLKIDVMGNIYCSAPGGVAIIRPETGVLGLIRVPDHVLNVAFGGPDGLTLLITGGHNVYTLPVKYTGLDFEHTQTVFRSAPAAK